MTRPLRILLVAALALSLIAASGCGSSDTKKNNDYVGAINKAQTDFTNSITKLQSGASATGTPQKAEQIFAKMKTAIDKVVADLKSITPPAKVSNLHQDLVREVQQFNAAVQDAASAAASADPQKILKAQAAFSTSVSSIGTKIGSTIANINTKLQK